VLYFPRTIFVSNLGGQVNRRSFIRSSIAAGAAGTYRSARAEPGSVRVGIVTEPSAAHLGPLSVSLAKCRGVAAVALADETGSTFEKETGIFRELPGGLRTFRDAAEMLRVFRPELAVVTLEAHRSPRAIQAALAAGCHVLAEKPACTSAEAFEPLVQTAEAKQRHLMLAFTSRQNPTIRKAAEVVHSGALGKLYGAATVYISDQTRLKSPQYQASWFASKQKAGGGDLVLHGIHEIDVLQFVTGDRIRRVGGFSRNVGGLPIDIEDSNAVAFDFASGMLGTMQSGYYLDKGYRDQLSVWGSDGWLVMRDPGEPRLEWRSTRPGAPAELQTFKPPEIDGWLATVQAAVDAARGTEKPFVTGRECLSVIRVIFGLYRAAATGAAQTIA
jgi:predicted dehydrogenase